MSIKESIKELREKSKKRNFPPRFDLSINLKEFDVNKAENKLDEIFVLPKGNGKNASITLFYSEKGEMEDCVIIQPEKIEELEKNKKELKKIINQTDFFLAEPKLMTVVGKHLGRYLAPRGIMPKPVVGNLGNMIKDFKNGVRLTVKKQPIIHTTVGSEKMSDEDIEENIKAIIEFLRSKLPKGKDNIKNIYLKLTMSKPIKLGV
jgi:large subunit ribosomal protein L1